MIPGFPPEETKEFYQLLSNSKVYFEYGLGGSTYQAFKMDNIKKIYSVESDNYWINKLYQYDIPKNNDKLEIIYIDIKAKQNNYGYPGKDSQYSDWIKYSRAFSSLDNETKKKVDLILIDGRFRVACALNLIKEIQDNTIVVFDDFFNRKAYHIVLDYYDVIKRIGRMAILKKKKNIFPPDDLIIKYEKESG